VPDSFAVHLFPEDGVRRLAYIRYAPLHSHVARYAVLRRRGARPVDQRIETPIPAISEAVRLSAGAERMRRHRSRKRKGLRCVIVQLCEVEIDVLISKKLLPAYARNDPYALGDAVHKHFDRTLGPTP